MSKHTIFGGKFTSEDKSGDHDSDTGDCDSEPDEEQEEVQGEVQGGGQEEEQGEEQEEGQEKVQGGEQGEGSEDEEDVPLAVLKQRRDAAYRAAKQSASSLRSSGPLLRGSQWGAPTTLTLDSAA